MSEHNTFSLRGKVIVQFGASGLLGRALLSSLMNAEATLIAASRNRETLQAIAQEHQVEGRQVEVEQVDISSENSLHDLRDRVIHKHQRVDGVVFNAVKRVMKGYDDHLSHWEESMATNATGFFATLRTFGDVMAAQGHGSLVNIGSIMGTIGMNPWLYGEKGVTPSPDYFFHKGGMVNLTRYLASHYGSRNVRVNTVSPGGIYNPEKPQEKQFLERYGKMTMLGRMANAHEICGTVVFLLSDASTYITGINLPVDGGYTAK